MHEKNRGETGRQGLSLRPFHFLDNRWLFLDDKVQLL